MVEQNKKDQFVSDSKSKLEEYSKQLQALNEADSGLSDKLSKLNERLDTAKKKYEEDSDVVNWAQAAETIGHALTRLGAAASGGSKADMSNLQLEKTNWEPFRKRAESQFSAEAKNIAGTQKSLMQDEQEKLKEKRRALSDLMKQEALNLREQERTKQAEAAADKRYNRDLELAKIKQSRNKQEEEEAKKDAALDEGLTQITNYQDLSSKEKARMLPSISKNLSKAGMHPEITNFLINPEGTGWFGGGKEETTAGIISGIRSRQDVQELNKEAAPYRANREAMKNYLIGISLLNQGKQDEALEYKNKADELIKRGK